MANERRSHKFIDHWNQVRIASEVVLYALTYMALIAMILFVPPFVTMFSSYSSDDHQAIAKELFFLNYAKWPLFLALALFVGIASILFSHRIVGPGYQLQRGLNELTDGNLGVRMKFRKWDFLMELQESFNRTANKLQEDIRILNEEHDRLRTLVGQGLTGDQKSQAEAHLASSEKILKSYRGLS